MSVSNPAKRRAPTQKTSRRTPSKRARLADDKSKPTLSSFADLLDDRAKNKIRAAPTRSAKQLGSALDESRAVVGGAAQDVDTQDGTSSSDTSSSSSSEEDPEEEEDGRDGRDRGTARPPLSEKHINGVDKHGEQDADEPSFEGLLRARSPEIIDVDAYAEQHRAETSTLMPSSTTRTLSVPSATSLGTVLTQALRSNDTELLESCLQVPDLDSIRSTIERLQSPLAAALLQKLAERMHKRPGRAGSLLVWIQWTFVTHGGYLAGQPEVVRMVKSLHRVITERSSGLQPLLALKGRLDMLDAQLELRRRMQRQNTVDEDEHEEAVIYVEGQPEPDTSDDEAAEDDVRMADTDVEDIENRPPQRLGKGRIPAAEKAAARHADTDEEEEDMPDIVNGNAEDTEENEGLSSTSESDDMIDDEADDTGDDTGDELDDDEIDYDDVDEVGETSAGSSSASDGEQQPAKRATARRAR